MQRFGRSLAIVVLLAVVIGGVYLASRAGLRRPRPARGGPVGGPAVAVDVRPMGKQLYDLSCASCHGATGAGNRFTMKGQTIEVPSLSYGDLAKMFANPSRGTFDQQIAAAITQGLDEQGQPLNAMMPRWKMFSTQQVDSLVGYIRATFK